MITAPHPIDVKCPTCNALEECACTFVVGPHAPGASMTGYLWFHDARIAAANETSRVAITADEAIAIKAALDGAITEITDLRAQLVTALEMLKAAREIGDLQNRALERALGRIRRGPQTAHCGGCNTCQRGLTGLDLRYQCDGEHGAPACASPQCWHKSPDDGSMAFPVDADLP